MKKSKDLKLLKTGLKTRQTFKQAAIEKIRTKENLENLGKEIDIIKNATLINMTSHDIKEINSGKIYRKGNKILRAESQNIMYKKINGSPIRKGYVKDLSGDLPDKKDNTYYIVSAMAFKKIKMMFPERDDFLAPGPILYRDKVVKNGTKKTIMKIKDGCNGFFGELEELDAYMELKRLRGE